MLCLRGSFGIETAEQEGGPDSLKWQRSARVGPAETSKNCKCFCFSPSGDMLAWCNGEAVHIAHSSSDFSKPSVSVSAARTSFMAFSPLGSTLATWEVYAVKQGQTEAKHNLNLWDAKTGKHIAGFTQKKASAWQPQWTKDEALCYLRSPNNEIVVYKDGDFTAVDKRLSIAKLVSFSASPGNVGGANKAYPVACFVPGHKGGPGFGKMYNYPNFNAEKDVIANKSFFNADMMDVEWSHDGRQALLLSQAEVDKSGESYYGKMQLHYINNSGDTAMVELSKNGPVYSISWNPTRPEFCVVYGFMPAKATVFNSKCDKVFDYGTGSRNMALYNPQGNLLLLGGFGNLRGNVEIWSCEKERKEVAKFEAPDSTDVRWSPSGKFLMTSTCAPRLRVGNGFRVWHYSSALLHEHLLEEGKEELWEVAWRNEQNCPDFNVSYAKVQGIQPKQPQASKVAYVPPSMRNKVKPGATFKLSEDEPAQNAKASDDKALSKSALKNKKRKEAKAKAAVGGGEQAQAQSQTTTASSAGPPADNEKALRKLNQKLQKIQELKQKQKEGKPLELNQLESLKSEQEVLKKIQELKLGA